MRKKRVIKVGGSVLKNSKDFEKVLKIIEQYGKSSIVVVSALSGITDLLFELGEKSKKDKETIEKYLKKITEIHLKIYRDLISGNEAENFALKLHKRAEELYKKLLAAYYLEEIPPSLLDTIISFGEKFSSLLFTESLKAKGVSTEEKLPENIGLKTDGVFGDASVKLEESQYSVRKALSNNTIYIIPGFYGISLEGKISVLGRGGSDYSAAAIANCVEAKSLDVWKDVNGFMSADPKTIKDAREIKRLSYDEAAELTYFGAKILHPRTFEPVSAKNIPVRIFHIDSSSGPENPATIIDNGKKISSKVIKSISSTNGMGILRLWGAGVGIKPGIMAQVTSVLNMEKINIKSIITSQTLINLLLSKEDLERSFQLLKKMPLPAVEKIEKKEKIAVIAVVGEGIVVKHGVAARIFNALAKEKINIEIISLGVSPVATYFIVEEGERDKALISINKEFFNENNQRNQ